jgi:hypothetical protein
MPTTRSLRSIRDAFQEVGNDFRSAFWKYERSRRPLVERVQAEAAEFGEAILVPETEAAIQKRNARPASGE